MYNLCLALIFVGRQVFALPMQTAGGLNTTTILKAANIKTEVGSPTTIIQQRGATQYVGGSPIVVNFFKYPNNLCSFTGSATKLEFQSWFN